MAQERKVPKHKIKPTDSKSTQNTAKTSIQTETINIIYRMLNENNIVINEKTDFYLKQYGFCDETDITLTKNNSIMICTKNNRWISVLSINSDGTCDYTISNCLFV